MRTLIRGIGQLFITVGVLLLLFVVYELFWTGLETGRAQDALRERLEAGWRNEPKATENRFRVGDGVGIMRIPRLGSDWSWVIVEGVTEQALKDGPGHYPRTAMPGEVGNFSVAGHRATNGEPFAYLDRVGRGDRVMVETADKLYTYVVRDTEITSPADVEVVAPVPNRPGERPTERLITLTTCHPRWASTHRLIVYGKLRSADTKPQPGATTGR